MSPMAPRIGLLPLYLELYDQTLPDLRRSLEPFLEEAAALLADSDLQVVRAPICRLRSEVENAVDSFVREQVDLIVTLHLAYSPSLESADPLVRAGIPILMLDATMDKSFGREVDPMRLLYNHGIHGVQDLASVLRRNVVFPWTAAGHLSDPRVMKRTVEIARAALAARRLRSTRALRIGPVFAGMGDFQVEDSRLRELLGVQVTEIAPAALLESTMAVDEKTLAMEMGRDHENFRVEAPEEVHLRSNRLGLGLRAYLEAGGYDAFSMNFLAFDSPEDPLGTVPFLECSKAMSRGVGYAGEGDVLTAALVGALETAFGETTFTEIFCPDWKGSALFLSHMGEVNPEVAADRPRLYEKEFPFTPARNPAALACGTRPGAATLVNLAPAANDEFHLIAAPVEVLADGTHPDIENWIRAWIRPTISVQRFLEVYSQDLGGTHHSALMLGDRMGALEAFARMAGLKFHSIGMEGPRS